jgi:hypothetical protein
MREDVQQPEDSRFNLTALLAVFGFRCYRVFIRVSDNCWREALPRRSFWLQRSAIARAQQLAKERGPRLWEGAGFVVSTHRDGPELYRAMCNEFQEG